tara:strand:- start:362 stop:622 length:261 start_codon:yes stop_codon:yes gene_type:complete
MVANKYIDIYSDNPNAVLPKDYKFNKIQKSPKVLQIKNNMLGFDFNGIYIVDPTLDETARFPVVATKYYNITARDRDRMIKANIKV